MRWTAGALSGVLLFICFPKVDWSFLVWFATLPLICASVNETRLLRAFGIGYLCGGVFFAGSCYWFADVMEQYGGLSPSLSVGVLLLFVIIDSIFFGGFALLLSAVARRSRSLGLTAAPFLWVTMELARTYLITGFPWNLLGYAVQPTGLKQVASVTAVYGLSFLAVATSALLAWLLLEPGARLARVFLPCWGMMLVLGNWALKPPAETPGLNQAYLLQPDVPLDETTLESWLPWVNPSHLNQLVDMCVSAAQPGAGEPPESNGDTSHGPTAAPLIAWAENPAPFYFATDNIFRSALQRMARQAHAYVVVNTVIPVDPKATRVTNSAIVLDPEGHELLRYDKIHLVPFGEYVPAWAFPGKVGKITSEVGSFVPGNSYRAARTPEGAIGVFICYEAIFPQLVRRIAATGAGVLVNISNDAWYGDTSAAFQHFEMARFRAIENGRYLLRATNNGISAVIDPYGRVVKSLPRHERALLSGRFTYLSRRTFYTAHGDVFAWSAAGVAIALMVIAAFPRRRTAESNG
jgi:apolipoprotein N-acyltransferase